MRSVFCRVWMSSREPMRRSAADDPLQMVFMPTVTFYVAFPKQVIIGALDVKDIKFSPRICGCDG